ncbi:hypothetical protein ACQ4PT_037203 [Festuca glaucescens]
MDFHALPRRDLQALAKRNGIRANMTNGAMADALAALPAVDGIEEYVQHTPDEVIMLDGNEEEKDLTPALGVGRRRVAWAEPVAATAKRKRAAARKADTAEAVAEGVLARATRARSQRTMESAVEDEAPKIRRTSRRAAGRKAGTQQEEEEKATQGDASDVDPAMAAPVSSDEGGDGAEEMEAAVDAQNEEQSQEVEGENEKEDAAAVAVQARATRARSQRTVLSVAEEEAPKARASRRAMDARNEEQHAPVEDQSQEVEGDTEKENAAVVAVPARATRARSHRTVMSVAEEEAPKARRASRRAVAKKNSTEQEDEEKVTQGDISDVEAAAPATVSSHEEADGSEDMDEAMDAQNAPTEVQSQEDEGETEKGDAAAEAVPARATRARRQRTVLSVAEEAMPARATRARSQKTVVLVAEEEATKGRRTSRRAAATKTSMQQEEEEKTSQGGVSDMEADVPAPVSSDEEQNEAVCGSEEMEAATDAQNEEQTTLVEEPSQEGETGTMHEEEEQGQQQQDTVSDVETAVPAASSDEEGDCAEEIEASMDAQDEEQTEQAEKQSREDEGAVADGTPLVEEPAAAEDCPVYSSVVEQTDTVSSEEIQHPSEDTEMVPVQEVPEPTSKSGEATEEVDFSGDVSEEIEDCTAEEEPPVAEDVDSSVQEATEEIHLPCEEWCEATVNEVPQATLTSGEATKEVGFTSDIEHASEENEECKVEEELQAAEDVQLASEENEDCKVEEELSVPEDVQQCEATEEIQLASEDTEMVPVQEMSQAMLESGEATEEVDCTSDVDEENEEFEEEPTLATEHVNTTVQEPLVDVQQCEATEEIQLASEDTEIMPGLESGEAKEEVDFTSDVVHASEENEVPTTEEVLQSAAKASEKKKDMAAEEVTNNTDMAAEEETLVATDEMPQMLEAMDEGVAKVVTIDYLSQANDEGGAAKESGFTADLTEVSIEEEAGVAADEMPQMLEAMDEGVAKVVTIDYLSQANDEGGVAKESGFTAELTEVSIEEEAAVAADEMPLSLARMGECVKEEVVTVDYLSQDEGAVKESGFSCGLTDVSVDDEVVVAADGMLSSATKEENAQEVFTVGNQSAVMVPDDEGEVKESGFTGELLDVFIEEQGVVAADEMLHSSATMEENVEEVVTVDNLWQATVTDDEGAAKESGFWDHLAHMSVDEDDVIEADEMQVSSATIEKSVEEVVTVDNLWQATVADDEWAVTESAFTGECTPVVDAPRDFSDHIASPWSANVFEDATKSLSMDSITVVSEPVAVQRENYVKEGNEPEAALGKTIHSPLTIEELRRAVAQENEADNVPCIFISSSGGEENSAERVLVEREEEVNEPEAALGKIIHSPLTIRKLRRAVAQENESDDAPLCIFISSSGGEEKSTEPVLVEREKEVNEPEAALGKIIHSPLTIRKLRRAVAEENEADDVPLCIFTSSSGGEENSAEPVLVEREKEVNDHEALGSISLRKLRTEFNQIVAVAQENEVKEGEKSSQPLDKLSLRKLRVKLKETLNAHKNMEPKRVPLGRLDENAC